MFIINHRQMFLDFNHREIFCLRFIFKSGENDLYWYSLESNDTSDSTGFFVDVYLLSASMAFLT